MAIGSGVGVGVSVGVGVTPGSNVAVGVNEGIEGADGTGCVGVAVGSRMGSTPQDVTIVETRPTKILVNAVL